LTSTVPAGPIAGAIPYRGEKITNESQA